MIEYKQSALAGTKWQRCNRVNIVNDYNSTPYIIFGEEELINLGDSYFSNQPKYNQCIHNFNPLSNIILRDPTTGNLTGSTMTHAELYQAMYSLYIETATRRDEDILAAEANLANTANLV